ncbi:MAG: hypothetical protein LBT97_00095 [Planctomycetota bacterium]|nr:hypothetical protein [Planctomycetota bacterium]
MLIAFSLGAAHAAGAAGISPADRLRLARNIRFHDFENLGDPETGLPSPLSADLDVDGWPDFWEPVRAVGYPEYLVSSIAIVRDSSPFVSGAYRDVDNHVLRMAFDGSRVGVRTSVPVPVDPDLAYEFSLKARDSGLEGAVIRAGVEWMRVDATATEYLRRDHIPGFLPGQADWPVAPLSALISEPPGDANAARLFVILEGDPDQPGLARHGSIWIDDIRLRQMPNIRVEAGPGDVGSLRVAVAYTGLADNVPDPDHPGYFRGSRYSRRVEVADVQGRRLPLPVPALLPLSPENGIAGEEIAFPADRYGVYYLNLRLYDADERLAADMTRAVAVMRERRAGADFNLRSGKPTFGVSAGSPSENILRTRGLLGRLIAGGGVRMVKIAPWPADLRSGDDPSGYHQLLAEEIRRLRSSGIQTTGMIAPPLDGGDGENGTGIAADIEERTKQLGDLVRNAGRRLGLYIDGWQWGGDADASLDAEAPPPPALSGLLGIVGEFSGGMPMIWKLRLDGLRGRQPPSPAEFGVVDVFVPSGEPPGRIWSELARVFPWLYLPFHEERGRIYPPAELTRLASPPPADSLETAERERDRRGSWITIESEKAGTMEPNAWSERRQLEGMMIKAVRAAALAPEALYLGDLFDPERGHFRTGSLTRGFSPETSARPTYLALGTISDLLEGAEYLGPLRLLEPFEAQAFRRPGSDEAVIVIWHNGPDGERRLDRGEIADGPPLSLIDWAGNRAPLPASVPVWRTPSFISGLPASLALTRMSVRISPEPPMLAVNRRQTQILEVANHLASQAPLRFRLNYAARSRDGGMEGGWVNMPAELAANLPPATDPPSPTPIRYIVSPDPNSSIQDVFRDSSDRSGGKLVQARMRVNSSPPADMVLYLGFNLRSDLEVDVRELTRVDDPNFCTLQLRVRWFPATGARRRGTISLRPFHLKRGDMRETAPLPVFVPASPAASRGDQSLAYETVELRIPRHPARQTWVGLNEEGGGGFYLADVTAMVNAAAR